MHVSVDVALATLRRLCGLAVKSVVEEGRSFLVTSSRFFGVGLSVLLTFARFQ